MNADDPSELRLRALVKKELRKRMRGVRGAMPAARIAEMSRAISSHIETHEAWEKARVVASFWPMEGRNEVDLRELSAKARAAGKAVAYPYVDSEARTIGLKIAENDEVLVDGPLGAKEPPPDGRDVSSEEIDVIVVPALAIDVRGHRIGYGGGFYDRLLTTHGARAVSIGVAFDFQLVGEVPFLEGDVAVKHVVTEKRSFAAGAWDDATGLENVSSRNETGVRVIARRNREER